MKAKNLGIFSAIFASVCCLGPFILVLIGLGSLGIGAAIGRYHWWFLGGGVLLIIIAWGNYFKEKKSCELRACQMENKRTSQIILTVVTLIVLFFVGLNFYTYLGQSTEIIRTQAFANTKTIVIPVEGMTCLSCELTVTHALKRATGVISAKASARDGTAQVIYEPDKINMHQLIEAINKTGYKAKMTE